MQENYDALIQNNTWALVPSKPGPNILGNKWVFHIKQNPNGFIARYKARLIVKEFHQQSGIDFQETFSPVINHITARTVLSIALNHKWGIRQLDVNNAFLNGHLTEDVYMIQLQGMRHTDYLSFTQGYLWAQTSSVSLVLGALHLLALSRLCHIPCGLVPLCLLP